MIELNRKVIAIVVALTALAMLALPISTVSATKPAPITGKWRPTGTAPISEPKFAGANAFISILVNGSYYEGPIIGSFTHTLNVATHYGEPERQPPATFSWKMERIFTGTVYDKEGTLLIHLTAKGVIPGAPGMLDGKWVIIGGTGELANLHGQGTFTNLAGGGGYSYEGQIHFDP